jgi:hypothetical protein
LETRHAASKAEIEALTQETLNLYRQVNLLYRIGESINACLSSAEVCQLVLRESCKILRASAGLIELDDGTQHGAAPESPTSELRVPIENAHGRSKRIGFEVMIETALGFVFGAPGCGKSFITIGMALSIAAKQSQWFGRDIKKTGPVIYISSEGVGDMKYRIAAWEKETGINADEVPFYLIRQTINFMLPTDVDRLIKTVAHVAQITGQTPVCIFVDTVSRVLPGADENLQKDMTLFIAACDALRTTFDATVVGVHHTSRAGNLRGSTVFDGAGDFLLGIEREEGEKIGEIHAKKIKSAQDGWTQAFELKTIVVNDITGEASLFACPCDEVKREINAWPQKDTCRKIIVAIGKAWNAGKPWSSYPQTRKQGRYAAAIIAQQFDVVEKVAENMIDTWLNNGILDYEMADKSTKLQGLRVIGNID